ncbi:MAG: PssE/Cps14G family polysaccharide biosynthesis glycosyltransferase [Candidatus Hodarchaeota archaeon]
MILVTVGMHSQGFDRLIYAMDQLSGKIQEKIIIQIGKSRYVPKNIKYFRFINQATFLELIKKSKLVISHGGTASIYQSLQYDKPIIIVPRLKKFGEHIDDHQLELAKYLEKKGLAEVVIDVNELEKIIKKCLLRKKFKNKNVEHGNLNTIIMNLINYIIK